MAITKFLENHKANIIAAARNGDYFYRIPGKIEGAGYVHEYMKKLGFVLIWPSDDDDPNDHWLIIRLQK